MTKSTTHKPAPQKKAPLRSKAQQRSTGKDRGPAMVGCPIVGIGASAGGLEAVTELLKALPPKPVLAFVLILHLDPTHESAMASLLSRATKMPVTEAKNNIPIEPGYYYKTYQEAREHGWLRPDPAVNPERVMSPGFTFPLTNNGNNLGANVAVVLGVIATNGIATWAEMPETSDYTAWPTESVFRSAMKYRGDTVMEIETHSDAGIEALKAHLASGDLAVLSTWVSSYVHYPYPGGQKTNNDVIYAGMGGVLHAFTLIGYDDTKAYDDGTGTKQGAFLAVNSWGPSWGVIDPDVGTGGFVWFSYSYLKSDDSDSVYATTDRVGYQPHTFVIVGARNISREALITEVYNGPVESPNWSTSFFPPSAGLIPFNGRMIGDLSPYTQGDDLTYWLRAGDKFSGGGEINYFAIERADGSLIESADVPKTTIPINREPHYISLGISRLRSLGDMLTGASSVSSGSSAWADVDADGDFDAAISGWMLDYGAVTKVYRNDAGNFVESNSLTGIFSGDAAFGDFDSDGDPDLFVCGQGNYSTQHAGLYRNDGGLFSPYDTSSFPIPLYCRAQWVDYDNDGYLDLAFTGRDLEGPDYRVYLFRNTGEGRLVNSGSALPAQPRGALAWADFDNDGDKDLFLSAGGYRNNGGSSFEFSVAYPSDWLVSSVGAADIDGDGWVDYIAAGRDSDILKQVSHTRYFRNQTDGTFADVGGPLTGLTDAAFGFGDANNDGLRDVAMTGHSGTKMTPLARLYVNCGNGVLRDAGANLGQAFHGAVDLLDYDGDRDADVSTVSALYQSSFAALAANDAPQPPSGLTAENGTEQGMVYLRWTPGTDSETSAEGLRYNVRLGTASGAADVRSGVLPHGEEFALGFGKLGSSCGALFRNLAGGPYYFSVQTIDAGGGVSAWSPEAEFVVPGHLPGDVNGDRRRNSGDLFFLINHVHGDGPAPTASGDPNGDGRTNSADIEYFVEYLFADGSVPKQ